MKRNRQSTSSPLGAQSGSAVLLAVLLLGVGYFAYSTYERIYEMHRKLFNAFAPLEYSLDLENFRVIAKTKITSQPRANASKSFDIPLLTKSLVYRVTHEIGVGEHHGTIELKVGDNGMGMEFLSSDIVVKFVAGSDDVSLSVPPFNYEVPSMGLHFGEVNGTYGDDGHLRLNISSLEAKMVNYLFKFSDMVVEIPTEQNLFLVNAKALSLDEVAIEDPRLSFKGVDPTEIRLNSKYKGKPVEVRWTVQKAVLNKEEVKIGSGNIKFPVELLDGYVEPKVNLRLLSQEKDAGNSDSEKVRFLFSAAKEVRKAEAKAMALRQMSFAKNIKREGDFYIIRIDKQDAFKIAEEQSSQSLTRREYVEGWLSLPVEKMLEEVFYGIAFGNEDRAQAAKELISLKAKELKDNALLALLKARAALRDAETIPDEPDAKLLEAAILLSEDALKVPSDHKLSVLLQLAIAEARKDTANWNKLFENLKTKEQNPQILSLIEFRHFLHVDNIKALEKLEAAYKIDPKSFYVQNYLRDRIHVYRHTGEKTKMEADLNTLLSSKIIYPVDLLSYAKILEEEKKLEDALKVLDKCLQMNALQKECTDQREHIMTLIAYEKQKQNQDEAILYLESILVDRPASVAVNAGLGFLYRMKGTPDKSINYYSIACALGGNFACIEAGDFLTRNGEKDRAILLYDVSCDLASGTGCLKAGLQSETSGQIERAGNFYDRACNQFRDNVGCYHLARNMQQKRKPNKDIAPYLTKACQNYPTACKLAKVYATTDKQPEIPLEPK